MPRAELHIFNQTLTPRHLAMLAAITVLVLLNIWRWWPESENRAGHDKSKSQTNLADNEINFLNYIPPARKEVAVMRNLFIPAPKKVVYKKSAVAKKKTTSPQKNTPDPRAALSVFKLEGVLDTDGKVQAFLSRQDEVYMVYKGERVNKTILVEKVTHNGILLKDESNGATHWVMLGGEQ